MDKALKKLIEKYGKTTDEALPDALKKIKANEFPHKDTDKDEATLYNQLRIYKTRHNQGKLGFKGLCAIMDFSKLEPVTIWVPKRKKPNEKRER